MLTNSERHFEAIPALRGCDPKRPITFPVYALPLLFAYVRSSHRNHRSARGTTLGTGGWLTLIEILSLLRGIQDLSRSGLSPDQIHHALRGALTRRITCERSETGESFCSAASYQVNIPLQRKNAKISSECVNALANPY